MANIETYNQIGEELERRLRLKTFPLAIKLLEKEDDIPEGAQRPLRDLGYHLYLCQGFQYSRREGKTIAMLAEDMWCFEPVIGYGLMAPPEYFLEGHSRFTPYPYDVMTLEVGKHYAEEFPKLEVGKYVGVVSAPLKTANFEPDILMVYCDSSQLSLLLLGREAKDGYNLKCALSSHAACVYSVVHALQNGQYQVTLPCRGDRYAAMAGDEEMIFTAPRERIEELIAGLRFVEQNGSRLPRSYRFLPEYPVPESYERMAKIMGFR